MKSDNSLHLLIGKDIATTASLQITDVATAGTYIADGEITILGENHDVLTAGDDVLDSPSITIVQGRGTTNGLKFSTKIDGSKLLRASALSYRAAAEQVSHVGYNGSSGAIDVIALNDYKLTITYLQDTDLYSSQHAPRTFYYTSTATDTQQTIAQAFIDMINDEDFYNATAALTNSGADYGISLTGRPLDFEVGVNKYNKMLFEVSLSGFGATAVTSTTAADLGSGTGEQVAEMEWFAKGFDGVINRVHFPAPVGTTDAVLAETYDLIALEYADESTSYAVSGDKAARAMTIVALPVGAGQATNFLAQLNPWIASATRPFNALAV